MAVVAYWIKTTNGLGGFGATAVGVPTHGSSPSAVAGAATFYGKGRCGICHTIGVARDGKCPNLDHAGDRLTREFIAESLLYPKAYIRLDFDPPQPKSYSAHMPQVNKPPRITMTSISSIKVKPEASLSRLRCCRHTGFLPSLNADFI